MLQQHREPAKAALSDTSPRPGLRLISFKPLRKGSLVGFATVRLPIGLKIVDCPVCVSHGRAWAALPAKPQFKDGQPIRDERGKLAYSPILEWRDKRLHDAFSERVVAAVRAEYPDVFTDVERGEP